LIEKKMGEGSCAVQIHSTDEGFHAMPKDSTAEVRLVIINWRFAAEEAKRKKLSAQAACVSCRPGR